MSSTKQDLSSSSMPPPVLAHTMTNAPSITTTNTNANASAPQQQQQNNQISPSSKQTSIQLRGARPADEQPSRWLERIRTVQLTTMTPEQREEIRRKTDEQAERYSKAKKLHAISHRTQNAKTTSYFAMDQNAVYRDRQNQVASVALMPPPPPSMMAGNNNNNAPASAPLSYQQQQQQPQHQQQAQLLMRQMDEDDELIAESFASSAPARRNKKESEQAPQAHGIRRPVIPVSAAREEKQMTSSPAWNQNQDAQRERVTETEEQQALRSLQTEPKTDDERSAKFEIFEKFSSKMMKIRKDLDDTVEETVVELPPLPREAVKQSLKKLESDNCRGIFDQSRFWFVHDMFVQASKNCDMMNSISDEIARKIRMVATNSQTECPICLLTFETENNGEEHQHQNANDEDHKNKQEGQEDEPKVPAMLLSCCHKVCEECWDQWSKLKAARVYCPLCRNEEFMKEVAAGGAENNNNEEEEE